MHPERPSEALDCAGVVAAMNQRFSIEIVDLRWDAPAARLLIGGERFAHLIKLRAPTSDLDQPQNGGRQVLGAPRLNQALEVNTRFAEPLPS